MSLSVIYRSCNIVTTLNNFCFYSNFAHFKYSYTFYNISAYFYSAFTISLCIFIPLKISGIILVMPMSEKIQLINIFNKFSSIVEKLFLLVYGILLAERSGASDEASEARRVLQIGVLINK